MYRKNQTGYSIKMRKEGKWMDVSETFRILIHISFTPA